MLDLLKWVLQIHVVRGDSIHGLYKARLHMFMQRRPMLLEQAEDAVCAVANGDSLAQLMQFCKEGHCFRIVIERGFRFAC